MEKKEALFKENRANIIGIRTDCIYLNCFHENQSLKEIKKFGAGITNLLRHPPPECLTKQKGLGNSDDYIWSMASCIILSPFGIGSYHFPISYSPISSRRKQNIGDNT